MSFKIWAVGEEVLAADFNSFIQRQVIASFPNAAARTAAIATPVEGQATYLGDVDSFEIWDGAAWRIIRPSTTARVAIGVRVVKSIVPGSGGQAALTMTGWASPPVVTITLGTNFAWFLTLGSISATQVGIWGWSAGGTPLPDNATLDMNVHAIGTPSGSAPPTIT